MKNTTKKVLIVSIAILLLTGVVFGGIAVFGDKTDKDKGMSDADMKELERLRQLQEERDLTAKEQTALDELNVETFEAEDGEVSSDGESFAFPIRGNDKGKHIAQIQLALNEKHLPGLGSEVYACVGRKKTLTVDGDMGGKTQAAIAGFYGTCCESGGLFWETCNCLGCTISKSEYNKIIKNADVSDEALEEAGYERFSGFIGNKTELRGEGMMDWKEVQNNTGSFYRDSMGFRN
tara:strand:+ start:4264 stop:4968 length:705 start_codon:yes stop_codon:yes gene_type:complete